MKESPALVLQTMMTFAFGSSQEASGERATAKLYGDQPGGNVKTNQTRRVGATILADDLPDLLHKLAGWCEQEGVTTTDDLARVFAGLEVGQ